VARPKTQTSSLPACQISGRRSATLATHLACRRRLPDRQGHPSSDTEDSRDPALANSHERRNNHDLSHRRHGAFRAADRLLRIGPASAERAVTPAPTFDGQRIRINNPARPPPANIIHSTARSDSSLPSLTKLPIIGAPTALSRSTILGARRFGCSGRATVQNNRAPGERFNYRSSEMSPRQFRLPDTQQSNQKLLLSRSGPPSAALIPNRSMKVAPPTKPIDNGSMCPWHLWVIPALQAGGRGSGCGQTRTGACERNGCVIRSMRLETFTARRWQPQAVKTYAP
jgi:hypothetical protein